MVDNATDLGQGGCSKSPDSIPYMACPGVRSSPKRAAVEEYHVTNDTLRVVPVGMCAYYGIDQPVGRPGANWKGSGRESGESQA